MVDVSGKAVTERSATAEGFVSMAAETLDLILSGDAPKGDVLATARIAGIMAAKRTHELIPLCHPLPLTQVTVDFAPSTRPSRHQGGDDRQGRGEDRRRDGGADRGLGRLPTIYDMVKAVDRAIEFSGIRLIEKTGGRSGTFKAGALRR